MMFRLAARRFVLSTPPCLRSFQSASIIQAPLTTKFNLPDPASPDEYSAMTKKFAPKLTKIVATIGPTSEQLPVLQEVVKNGMRIMRLNFSHATTDEVELRIGNLQQCRGRHSMLDAEAPRNTNLRAVLLDTKGPEVRSGKLQKDKSGHETIHLVAGNTITLHTASEMKEQGTETDLYIDYPKLHKSLSVGMKVLLDDGAVALIVTEVETGMELHGKVKCIIENSGELRSRAGVNLPGADTDLPAMSDKDKVDIKYGMTMDVDYVAASFVQNAEAVHEIRAHIQKSAKELGWADDAPLPLIISKIESMSALKHFDAILEASDGIMVARGDLGVEIPIQQVTNAQKEMCAACNAAGKPVIVATQMLESMAKNPRPTRAEVSDVTNAVYDGADCVMLSGETAKGKYPVDAVRMMNEIIGSAEGYLTYGGIGATSTKRFPPPKTQEAAIASAAVAAAEIEGASAILVLAKTSTLPGLVSAYRPNVPIVTFCPTAKLGRQLMVFRGVHPIIETTETTLSLRMQGAVTDAQSMGFIHPGDTVVVVTMESDTMEAVHTLAKGATMKIITVP